MGEVYLALLERPGGFSKQVALKVVVPELAGDAAFSRSFEREARLAALLNHRNIVQVFDFGRAGDRLWLAMEYVEGTDLRSALGSCVGEGLPPALAVDIGASCARALDYVHRCTEPGGAPLGLVHRDISPHNVMLSFEGDVKLADFGLAQRLHRAATPGRAPAGKLAYMSPEQAAGEPLDGRSDQYSLGVVLYEALSGHRALRGTDGEDALRQRVLTATPLVQLAVAAPGLPEALVRVVQRATERRREDRFPDAASFAIALRRAAADARLPLGEIPLGTWLRARVARGTPARSGGQPVVEETAAAGAPIAPREPSAVAPPASAPPQPPEPPRPAARWRFAWVPLALLLGAAFLVAPRWLAPDARDAGVAADEVDAGATGSAGDATRGARRGGLDAGVGDAASDPGDAPRTSPDVAPDRPDVPPASDARAATAPPNVRLAPGERPLPTRPPPVVEPRRPRPAGRRPSAPDPPRGGVDSERPAGRPAATDAGRPASPRLDAGTSPAAATGAATLPVSSEDAGRGPTVEPPVPPSGPRVQVAAPGASATVGGQPAAGRWWPLGQGRGLLVGVRGGAGPPARLRLLARGALVVANVAADPWATVLLDGRPVGETPLAGLPLPSGASTLELRGPRGVATSVQLRLRR